MLTEMSWGIVVACALHSTPAQVPTLWLCTLRNAWTWKAALCFCDMHYVRVVASTRLHCKHTRFELLSWDKINILYINGIVNYTFTFSSRTSLPLPCRSMPSCFAETWFWELIISWCFLSWIMSSSNNRRITRRLSHLLLTSWWRYLDWSWACCES